MTDVTDRRGTDEPTRMSQPAEGGAPLAGIRVLDFTAFESGTSATQLMAWFGAEVIKIELPGRGDQSRAASSERPDVDSWYFLTLNSNKKSMTLDIKNPEGYAVLRRLVAVSHVVIENWAPGVAEKNGVTFRALRDANPDIICASIKGFRDGTRYAGSKSFDSVAQATGGSSAITGFPDGPPLRPGPTMADTGSGLLALIGVLMGLLRRERGAGGCQVDAAMEDAVMNFTRVAYARHAQHGIAASRFGNQMAMPSVPSNMYRCAPGGPNDYCFIYPGRGEVGNRGWRALLQAMGRTDLLDESRFATADGRIEHQREIDDIVEEWTSRHTKEEVMAILSAVGVPCGPVHDTADITSDPTLLHAGSIVELDHPERGKFRMPGVPFVVRDSAGNGLSVPVVPSPLLGEHTDSVLGEVLGLTSDDLASLRDRGVI